MPDKCPWCGADRDPSCHLRTIYDCGSDDTVRSPQCRVHTLNDTVARMRPVIDAAVAWSTLSGSRVDLLLAIEKYNESELHA